MPERPGAGRPQHVPTDQSRQLVQVLRSCGIPIKTIARNVHLDIRTLRRHYADELKYGTEQVIAALSASVIKAGLNGDWRAALSWLQRFAGPQWRMQTHPDRDGNAPIVVDPSGGGTTIIIRGGLPPVPQDGDPSVSLGGSELDDLADLDPFTDRPEHVNGGSNGKGNGTGHTH